MKAASDRGVLARRPIAILAGLAVLALAACSSAATSSSTSSSPAAGSSAAGSSSAASSSSSGSTKTISIGFDAEASGALASFGDSFLQAAKAGVAFVNQSGGVTVNGTKYDFYLDVCNDNSDQTQVAACGTKLVTTDGDKFIFGGLADYGPIIRGITEPAHAIYFSTGSAVAALMSSSHYVVNTVPSLPARSLMSVEAFKKAYPNATTVALLGEQDATDQAAFAADEVAFKQEGLKLVGTEIAPVDATDYSSYLTALKADHPDVIWNELAAAVNSEPSMLGQNGSLKASPLVFNNSGACDPTYPHTPGITYVAETNSGAITVGPLENADTKKYESIYYSLGGITNPDPNIGAGLYIYDFFPILAQAIEAAGTFTNTSAVLAAVNKVSYTGADGPISISNDQATYGQVICTMANGNGPQSQVEVFPNGTLTAVSASS
jgi:ABC-type branched-subunit amino acid transport system substrate-binding protein